MPPRDARDGMTFDDVVADGYVLDVDERFEGPDLDPARWVPWYLPQWSGRARSAARYELTHEGLILRIDADQEPWCPELDGTTRVSSIQTGVFAGPLGSTTGQHRFHPSAVVREEQDDVRLWTPKEGAFEMRARMELDAASMAALWMIGYEDRPERSAEICIAEVFGRNVTANGAVVGLGLHPFGDHGLVDDFTEIHVAIDVREPHAYAAEWTSGGVSFWIDGLPVREVAQAPSYPMQLMLGLYAFDEPGATEPRRFVVERIRGWRPIR